MNKVYTTTSTNPGIQTGLSVEEEEIEEIERQAQDWEYAMIARNQQQQLTPWHPNQQQQLTPWYPNQQQQLTPWYPNQQQQLTPWYPNPSQDLQPYWAPSPPQSNLNYFPPDYYSPFPISAPANLAPHTMASRSRNTVKNNSYASNDNKNNPHFLSDNVVINDFH
jgi:hypothetical protein